MKLTKKSIKRLYDEVARKQVLLSMSQKRIDELQIDAYAKALVKEQILARDLKLKDDKESFYGLPPLMGISAMLTDGKMFSFVIECNVVNHFLRGGDVSAATEAVKCMLIMLAQEKGKQIRDFNVKDIAKATLNMRTAQAMHMLAEEVRQKKAAAEISNDVDLKSEGADGNEHS